VHLQPLSLSHFSIVSSLGDGQEATTAALVGRTAGLRRCAFESVAIPTWVGEVAGLDDVALPHEWSDFDCRNNRLADRALAADGFAEAVAEARARYGAPRIGVFLGTSTSGILEAELAYRRRDPATGALPPEFSYARTQNMFSLADFVSRRLGLEGPAVVVSAACASSAKAFGNAARMIAAGVCDAAVVGGADSLCLTTLYGFRSLMLTSNEPCRPFDATRDGISIGEAAGFALLEKATHAAAGSVMLLGIGESSDAHHMSAPRPDGVGARRAMELALKAARLAPEDIDYINLHGTGTQAGDAAEDRAVAGLFGTRTPCSSTKGQTGHTLGASGIIEAAISALSILRELIPGSPETRMPDPALRSQYVLHPERARLRHVLSNSFGFGGSNCSLVFGRA
jgi:3-oxoacyl-[acyl-carrier-protein] synthase-1